MSKQSPLIQTGDDGHLKDTDNLKTQLSPKHARKPPGPKPLTLNLSHLRLSSSTPTLPSATTNSAAATTDTLTPQTPLSSDSKKSLAGGRIRTEPSVRVGPGKLGLSVKTTASAIASSQPDINSYAMSEEQGSIVSSRPLSSSAHTPASPLSPGGADNDGSAPYKHEPVMIMHNLYLGSEKNASSKQVLVKKNIRYILNVGIECKNHFMPKNVPATRAPRSASILAAEERQKRRDSDISSTHSTSTEDDSSTGTYPLSPLYNPLNMVAKKHRIAAPTPLLPATQTASMNSHATKDSPEEFIDVSNFQAPAYLHLPWTHSQDNLASDLPRAFAFIDQALTENVGVLVHCKQGVSRSASLVIGYIMQHERMRLNDAYAFVKNKSPNVTPNLGLVYQLLEYEKFLFNSDEPSIEVMKDDT